MNTEHAEHTLETIRTLMERSQCYEHISGYSGLLAGSAVMIGCGVLASGWLPFSSQINFALVWSIVLAVAFTGHVCLTFGRAHRRGEPVWSRQARTVLLAVLPSFLASLPVTALMWRLDRLDLLPSFWLLLYGCAALTTSFFAPRSILILGAACLTVASTFIIVAPARPLLTMAVGFGFTHLAFGSCVLFAEWKENQTLAQWASEELSWDQSSPL